MVACRLAFRVMHFLSDERQDASAVPFLLLPDKDIVIRDKDEVEATCKRPFD